MKSSINYTDFWNLDLSQSIKPYEFSKEAFKKVGRIINMSDFLEMNSSEILDYLIKELRMVPFGDYLKRYLYLEMKPDMDFPELPDSFYVDTILASFKENHVPFHIKETTTSPRRIVSRWLKQGTVGRNIVFLLGFGLRMKTDEVSDFLTKVIQEEDFIFEDYHEVIYHYCYEHELPYAFALEMIRRYESDDFGTDRRTDFCSWEELMGKLEYKIAPKRVLMRYLSSLKGWEMGPHARDTLIVFNRLYDQVCERIVASRLQESKIYHHMTPEQIAPADVEKELYAGIPRTGSGNLKKTSLSILSDFMNCHFLSRQRIEKIRSGKYPVRRFDIMNLSFYLHGSDNAGGRTPEQRFLNFAKDVNDILDACHMFSLHPSNPTDAFMMICMLSELPLITYSDVLEQSFKQMEEE